MGSQVKVPMGIPALRPGHAPPGVDLECPMWDPQAGPGEAVELRTTAFSPVCQEIAPHFRAPDRIGDIGKTVLQAGGPAPSMGFTSWRSSFGLNFNISGLFPVCRESSVNG